MGNILETYSPYNAVDAFFILSLTFLDEVTPSVSDILTLILQVMALL